MKHPDVPIHNIADLISKLEAHRSPGDKIWFRGHANKTWDLAPSISRGRTNPIVDEFRFFKQFKQDAARVINDLPADEWGWMFLMQHYGVPTRLLDFSENPLVALFFAVCEQGDEDGSLIVIDPAKWNKENGHSGICDDDIPSCGIDEEMNLYMMSSVVKARGTSASNPPLAATGSRNSRRIFAQEGVFVVFHMDMAMNIDDASCQSVWKYTIPSADKATIKEHLSVLSITEYTVFPELDKLAKKIIGL